MENRERGWVSKMGEKGDAFHEKDEGEGERERGGGQRKKRTARRRPGEKCADYSQLGHVTA